MSQEKEAYNGLEFIKLLFYFKENQQELFLGLI